MYTFIDKTEYMPFSMKSFDRYFKGARIGFFDIETTGLKPDRAKLILSGIAVPEGDTLYAKQFLAESEDEENEVIEATLNEFKDLDVIVTFNGATFDVPFFTKRCERTGIDMPPLPYDLDIYKVIKRFSGLKGLLPNLRQVTIENYLGLWRNRTDTISGKESISLYYHYANTGDPVTRDIVLLHNHDDICQLSRLLQVLTRTDFDEAVFNYGFPVGTDTVSKIKLRHNAILVSGVQRKDPVDFELYDDFDSGAYISVEEKTGSFDLRIPVISGEKYTVADLRMLGIDPSSFDETIDDFLILKTEHGIDHGNINRLITEMVRLMMGKARDQ